MNLITINNLTKTYGEKTLFKNISLSIESNDKIGLIGINGTGKTTLLNIIAGTDSPDNINMMTKNSLSIEYLSQNPKINDDVTVLNHIFKSDSPVLKIIGEYEDMLIKLEDNPEMTEYIQKINQLNTEMEAMNAWQMESEAKSVLTRLGIKDFNQKMGNLSGGQRKRVALAASLINPCDLLILDEPTNHIDNDTIEYLEQYLISKKSAILMVTHDRYFLEKVTNTICELERGYLHRYGGSYSKYLELKTQRLYDEKRIEEKKQSLYKQELEWMRKGVEARRTKAKYRKDAFYSLEESLNKDSSDQLTIDVAGSRLGSKILEFQSLSKTYDEVPLFQSPEYTILKTDRIGIVGLNGSGKTTLLNLLAGRIDSDEGVVQWGSTVKLGYFTQEQRFTLDPSLEMRSEQKVIDYVKEGSHFIEKSDGTKITAEKMLESFLFPPHSQYNLVSSLSGGEKRRLYLLRILMGTPNVLFLDEPTNDLDIETLEILEDYISDFNGPVITVSHDRYFLDKVCNKIFAFSVNPSGCPKSDIVYYTGNYSDYKEKCQEEIFPVEPKEKSPVKPVVPKTPREKKKLTYKEQKQWETIEDEIVALETQLTTLDKKMHLANADFVLLTKLSQEKEDVETQLLEKMELWENLSKLISELH